jgi:hypothetical protein
MTTNDNPAPNDDEWVSVNGHLDYHLGFIDSGIADDIEQRADADIRTNKNPPMSLILESGQKIKDVHDRLTGQGLSLDHGSSDPNSNNAHFTWDADTLAGTVQATCGAALPELWTYTIKLSKAS